MVPSSLPIPYKGTGEPWRTLAEAAYNSFHGHDISHVQIPSGEHLQGLRRIYYDKAVSLLSKANLTPMDYFALFTALSGIVDLRAAHASDVSEYHVQAPELLKIDPRLTSLLQDLRHHLAQGLKVLSGMSTKRALKANDSQQRLRSIESDSTPSSPSPPQRVLSTSGSLACPIINSPILPSPKAPKLILDVLKTPVSEQNLWNSDVEQGRQPVVTLDMFIDIEIQEDMDSSSEGDMGTEASGGEDVGGEGEDQYRVYRPVIELVRCLAGSIEQGEFSRTKDSIANHWKTCLECLSDNRLDLRTGNNSIALNTTVRRLHGHLAEQEIEFVRADDLVMVVDGLEVLIFTVHETESALTRETLYLENLRLNKTVELAATEKGVPLRTMYSLNIGGMSAMVCALRKMKEGGYLGGVGCDFSICIPENKEQMVGFLSCDAPQLFRNYTKLLLEYQDDVRQTLASMGNRAEP
ncbi:hypothetical protein BGZ82_004415 [Podila clonocystis]|nr:hypothetical protein BGZ82_004415 [Podila clonocystis]